jgi:hypothetical protein
MRSNLSASRFVGLVGAGALTLVLGSSSDEARGQSQLDPEADRVLRSMSEYLGKLPAFSADYDTNIDYVLRTGEKIQLSASGKIELKRPGGLYVVRRGGLADLDMVFNGKTFTLYGYRTNLYAQKAIDGSIEQAVETLRAESGLDLSGGDLLSTDTYTGLMSEVESSTYWGTTFVAGIECHYLTFRARNVDWQIWVQVGDKPVPMKYVITSKWVASAPHYSISLWNWNTSPTIAANRFEFVPPSGARKLDQLQLDDNQELVAGR